MKATSIDVLFYTLSSDKNCREDLFYSLNMLKLLGVLGNFSGFSTCFSVLSGFSENFSALSLNLFPKKNVRIKYKVIK